VTLPLPAGDFRAYLFDCDGTIVDSMPLHYLAWSKAVGEWGCEFPEDLFYAWGGRPVADIITALNELHGLAMPIASVDERRDTFFRQLLPQLATIPEVLEHLDAAHPHIPCGVVSGGARESVTASLRAVGVLEKFEVLVCAGDYVNSKPHPEAFLLAAQLLNVAPEHCLVFEDAELGIQAATAAGMASVLVPSAMTRTRQGSVSL
jgi:beta-phosphoglucomutase-like phosphatase (HAD superfamily)